MSDLNEEYQEQVLEDLSDIKESVTTDSGYQEKVLDDLEDIKESVSEEQEYYDKEYQKKVLGNLRSLQKSVEALNDDYIDIEVLQTFNSYRNLSSNGLVSTYYNYYFACFDILDKHNLKLINNIPDGNSTASGVFVTCNVEPSEFIESNLPYNFDLHNFTNVDSNTFGNEFVFTNNENDHYLYFEILKQFTYYTPTLKYLPIVNEDNNEVTSGSAVMVEGIDTLIQISTFQGFASALLTGILLFLVFVKGLRR